MLAPATGVERLVIGHATAGCQMTHQNAARRDKQPQMVENGPEGMKSVTTPPQMSTGQPCWVENWQRGLPKLMRPSTATH